MALKKVTSFFDYLRGEGRGVDVTEEKCISALNQHNIQRYASVSEISIDDWNCVLQTIIKHDKFNPLNTEQYEDMKKILEGCALNKKVFIGQIAKVLRYLLRKDSAKKTALIVVDVQNDFISGSLALKNSPAHQDGCEVVPIINKMIADHTYDLVAYTIDWHPANHCSFVTNVGKYPLDKSSKITADGAKLFDTVVYDGEKVLEQVLWPPHCVQHSDGAKLHPDLKILDENKSIQVYKGSTPNIDSYSAFWDNGHLSQTNLFSNLIDRDINTILLCGLATDFCVAFTALDGITHGFDTFVVEDACRGVANSSMASMRATERKAGIQIIESSGIAECLT